MIDFGPRSARKSSFTHPFHDRCLCPRHIISLTVSPRGSDSPEIILAHSPRGRALSWGPSLRTWADQRTHDREKRVDKRVNAKSFRYQLHLLGLYLCVVCPRRAIVREKEEWRSVHRRSRKRKKERESLTENVIDNAN
jgi:hypothetical protein